MVVSGTEDSNVLLCYFSAIIYSCEYDEEIIKKIYQKTKIWPTNNF